MVKLRTSHFRNDEYCENLTRIMKHGLFNFMPRLGLEAQVLVSYFSGRFCVFYREENFMCTLIKLVHGLTHTEMSDFICHQCEMGKGNGTNS